MPPPSPRAAVAPVEPPSECDPRDRLARRIPVPGSLARFLQGGLRSVDQQPKPGLVRGGHFGQHFTVEPDAGSLQPMHELAVRNSGIPAGGVNAHNPQRPVIALLVFAAGIGELQPPLDRFLRSPVQLAFGEKITGCALQRLLARCPAGSTTFYSRHVSSPWMDSGPFGTTVRRRIG